jgi:uncharacterized protein YhdP
MRVIRSRACAAALGLVVSSVAGIAAFPGVTGASSATGTISAGTLAFVQPASVSFTATLTGVNQTVNSNQSFDVTDATGSGTGWNITATSTAFTTGSRALPTTAVTVQAAPTQSCDASATCTLATTNVNFPYTLPAGATAPTATKIYNSTADSGMGAQTSVAVMRLALAANTYAGIYTSTWTYSLVSAP